jgi:hypothetical protein
MNTINIDFCVTVTFWITRVRLRDILSMQTKILDTASSATTHTA